MIAHHKLLPDYGFAFVFFRLQHGTVADLRGVRIAQFDAAGETRGKFLQRIHRVLLVLDATEFVDRLKAIKSEEEKALIRKAAEMQDAILDRKSVV